MQLNMEFTLVPQVKDSGHDQCPDIKKYFNFNRFGLFFSF